MAVNPVNGSSSTDPYSSLNGSKTDKTSELDAAQNRFLMLLTTQLKMQDPLSPMDNAQVTSQLAQISTVDGITKLNGTLEQMMASSTGAQQLQAAALVGHAVLIEGSALKLVEGQSMGGVELAGPADQVTVTIKGANGVVVREVNLGDQDGGVVQFAWDGKDNAGTPVAQDGSYSFSVKSVQKGKTVTSTPLELAVVSSVERSGGNVRLNVGQQGLVAIDDIKQIY